MITDNARAVKRNLLTPYKNVTGKKTTTVVSVAASTARLTSAPPCSAARFRRGALFQMPVDIFERNDRIIDDTGEGQRKPAQDHGVDRASQKIQNHKRSQG